MSYKVIILGKGYELPPRTISIDEAIEAVGKIDSEYESGVITRREAVEKMHAFVEDLAPGALPRLGECDTNDLLKACLDIISTYDAPARKVRNEERLSEAREILSRPEIAKIIELARIKK